MRTLPLAEAKAQLSRLVDRVAKTEEEILITRNGRPAAVLVSPDEYESWKETQAIRSDREFPSSSGRSALASMRFGWTLRRQGVAG